MIKYTINFLQNNLFKLTRMVGIFGSCLLLIMVILTVSDVVLRRFFNAPIRGSLELTQLILGISVSATLAFCALVEGGHVEVEILVNRFSKRTQKIIVSAMYFLTTVMLALNCWQLVVYAIRVFDMNEVSAILVISPGPFIAFAAFGMALLTLVFFTHFLVNVSGVSKNES